MQNKLNSEEVLIVRIALAGMLEDMQETYGDPSVPFTKVARIQLRQMIACAKSAQAKFALITGNDVQLRPYQEGDEAEFLTKQS